MPAQRRRELAIRAALGASRLDLLGSLMWFGSKPILAGVAIGLVVSAMSSTVIAHLLFGVPAREPSVFVGVGVAIALIGLAACSGPAIKAAAVNPAEALRIE